ncbi:hypothetical protein NDU88_005560 [Pleurodeles waltl]|uniref:Uncharacterized protein n=1 Tax=Pleurodeles waltl TaxID=8319 RepID=A0AAV7UJ66_PLEWA|nr:hypothetical protein NDU88_005560 [Pleurodeles waltl]
MRREARRHNSHNSSTSKFRWLEGEESDTVSSEGLCMESVECENNAEDYTGESENSAEVNEEIGGYEVSAEANKDVEGMVSEALDGGKGRVRKPPDWLKDFVWGEKVVEFIK